MALAAKQDVHCWKETLCNFISFLLLKNGIKPDSNYPVKFSMQCNLFPLSPVCSQNALKDNLCMDHALLDRESLDCVS